MCKRFNILMDILFNCINIQKRPIRISHLEHNGWSYTFLKKYE